MMQTQQQQMAFALTTTWQRVTRANAAVIGTLMQNQTSNGTANIFISCDGAATSDAAAIQLPPSAVLYEDIVPPNGDIWAKTDAVGGATLTLVLKFARGR